MMYPWSEQRVAWYLRAVAYNGFDRVLADAIAPYLPSGETVCDLGCGTGYLALYLARRGYFVTAFDKPGPALDAARREKKLRGTDSLTVTEGDWFTLEKTPRWDNVVMAFAGHLDEDLELFLSLARKRLILIIKDDDQSHVQASGVAPLKHVTGEQIERLLAGRSYESFPLRAQFGQPLRSMDEAREYLNTYDADTDSEESALRRLIGTGNAEYPLFLPSEKRMRVFVIRVGTEETPCTR